MLRFLRKKLPNIKQRHDFLLKTIIVSSAVHCVVMIILLISAQLFFSHTFIVRKGDVNKHMSVMLIPLARRVATDPLQTLQQETKEVVEEEKKITNQKMLPEKVLEKNIQENEQKSAQEEQQKSHQEHIVHVGREDLQELKLYKAVYHALEKEWQPPVGLPAACSCKITFNVNEQGKAHTLEVLESSKIVAYDIAARSAVLRAHFGRQAHGKKCTIVFTL